MKSSQQMNALIVGLVLTSFPITLGQTYGPNGCVSISRSQQGTCVIATNCEDGVNLDKLEFAFDCQTKAQIQKHSFGVGGFDLVEEFDTGIKCGQCDVPQNHKVHKVTKPQSAPDKVHKATKKAAVHLFGKRNAAEEDAKEDALVDKYGPGECVEAYRSTTGTCMIKTQCKGQDISNYDFGLLCVTNVTSGENVRHLFGKNSFDPEEEFDTLIKCEKCLGLRAEAKEATITAVDSNIKSEDLVKKVNTLVDEVGAMQTGLEKIKKDVTVLKEKVPKLYTDEGKGEAKEEAKDEAKEEEKKDEGEAEEKKPELLLSHHRSSRHSHKKLHQKRQQRHHLKKHRSSDEDEDNDEDQADDADSEDTSSSKKDSRDQDDQQDEDDSTDQDQEDSDDKKVDDDAKDSEDGN